MFDLSTDGLGITDFALEIEAAVDQDGFIGYTIATQNNRTSPLSFTFLFISQIFPDRRRR